MSTIVVIGVSVVLFALVMLLMAVGVMFKRPCLRGSCGGEDIVGPDGELLTCDTCPRRKEHEEEFARKREEAARAAAEAEAEDEEEASLSVH